MKRLFTIILILSGSIAFAQRDTNAHEIPWKPIKKEDILWQKRVWREIAIYEKTNAPLRDDPRLPQENIFANVLLSGINASIYIAYGADSESKELMVQENINNGAKRRKKFKDRNTVLPASYFIHPLTKEDVNQIITCDPAKLSATSRTYINFCTQHKNDTSALSHYDSSFVTSCIYPQQVDHYGIIEDWIFDKEQGQMVVQIRAIAPMVQGKPLFWLSYPDIRRYLAQYEVYADEKEARLTWDEYFESRQFSSKITRVGPSASSFEY